MDLKTYLNSKPRGEAARLARVINEKPSNLSLWKNKRKPIPPYKCRRIVNATHGEISLQELRPDDFAKHFSEILP